MAVYPNGQWYCDQLCQHPGCWKAHQLEDKGMLKQPENMKFDNSGYQGLPTQTLVEMSVENGNLPFDSDNRMSSRLNFPAALMEKILRCSNSKSVKSQRTFSEEANFGQKELNEKVNRIEINTLNADDVIGDSSEANLPNKFYIWVPNPKRQTKDLKDLNHVKMPNGKMSVTTLSVNESPYSPKHRYEPNIHSARLRHKQHSSGSTLLRTSKENSSFISAFIEPHNVSPNDSSTEDSRNLSGQLSSRTHTVTFPNGLLPVNRNANQTSSDLKINCNTDKTCDIHMTKEKQVTAENPRRQSLPPIDAVKYHGTQLELIKQPKYSSILLEPNFEYCQRKYHTMSGKFNLGIAKQAQESILLSHHQEGSADDDPDVIDVQKWFKVETQTLQRASRPIRVPFGNQNSSSQSNSAAPTTSSFAAEPGTPAKSANAPRRNRSSVSFKETSSSDPPLSPLRRTGSKIVTFAPAFPLASSHKISLNPTPAESAKLLARTSNRERLAAKISRVNKDQQPQTSTRSPFPQPPPSPETKSPAVHANAMETQGLTESGDSESELTLTARPPTNFEDESIIGTPALSNAPRSQESSKDVAVIQKANLCGVVAPKERDGQTDPDVEMIATNMVTVALAAARQILTTTGATNFEDRANKTSDEAACDTLPHEITKEEDFLDTNCKALKPPYPHNRAQNQAENENDQGLKYELDRFDTTEEDFAKELKKEYDKLC